MSKLLIHACCAPCATYPLELLETKYEITVLYYNPNVESIEEFEKRYEELERYLDEVHPKIELIKEDYSPEEFEKVARGYKKAKEGGARCKNCYSLRMMHTAAYAKENNFDLFTTTLSTSPQKDAKMINLIGYEAAKKYNISFLESNFKKNEGFKRSVELSKEHNLYRQSYCGCIYSKRTQK